MVFEQWPKRTDLVRGLFHSRKNIWLVVYLPLWKMMEFKSVGIIVPNCLWKVIIHSCSKPPTRYTSCRRGSAYHRDFCPTAKWPYNSHDACDVPWPIPPLWTRHRHVHEEGVTIKPQPPVHVWLLPGSEGTKVWRSDMMWHGPPTDFSCASMLSGMTMVIVVANIALITMTNNTIYNTIYNILAAYINILLWIKIFRTIQIWWLIFLWAAGFVGCWNLHVLLATRKVPRTIVRQINRHWFLTSISPGQNKRKSNFRIL